MNASDRQKEWNRAKRLYSKGKHGLLDGFKDGSSFADWWMASFDHQEGCCTYCQTSIDQIRKLIDSDLIRSRKVRGAGQRGRFLELERKDPNAGYKPENCALVCYYCNNDKSYIYSENEYRAFFGPVRKRHFDHLASRISS